MGMRTMRSCTSCFGSATAGISKRASVPVMESSTATEQLAALFERIPLWHLASSMQEIDAGTTCKKNNLHEYVKRRAPKAS